jgi:hypothetical protein
MNRFFNYLFVLSKIEKYEKVNQLRVSIHNVTCAIIPDYRIIAYKY